MRNYQLEILQKCVRTDALSVPV